MEPVDNVVFQKPPRSPTPSLVPDCVGAIVSFLQSSETFFRILRVSSHIGDYFHSYGAESCENIVFRISKDRTALTVERIQGKPYILTVEIRFLDGGRSRIPYPDCDFFRFFDSVRNLTLSGSQFQPRLLLLFSLPVRESLRRLTIRGFQDGYRLETDPSLADCLAHFRSLEYFSWSGGRSGSISGEWRGKSIVGGDPPAIDLPALAFGEVVFRETVLESNTFLDSSKLTLRSLYIDGLEPRAGLREFFSGLSHLQNLSKFQFVGVHDEVKRFGELFPLLPPSLRDFELRSEDGTPMKVTSDDPVLTRSLMKHLGSLEKFVLSGFVVENDLLMGLHGEDLRYLRLIDLIIIEKTSEVSEGRNNDFVGFDRFPNIQTLHLISIVGCSLDFSRCKWPHLCEAHFGSFKDVRSCRGMLGALKTVKVLTYSGCPLLEECLAEELSHQQQQGTPTMRVESLDLRINAKKISVTAYLRAFDADCLHTLRISKDCVADVKFDLTDSEVSRFRNLRHLSLRDHPLLEGTFVESMPRLEVLAFGGNSKIFPLGRLSTTLRLVDLRNVQLLNGDFSFLVNLRQLHVLLKPHCVLGDFVLPEDVVEDLNFRGADLKSIAELDPNQFQSVKRLVLSGTTESQQELIRCSCADKKPTFLELNPKRRRPRFFF